MEIIKPAGTTFTEVDKTKNKGIDSNDAKSTDKKSMSTESQDGSAKVNLSERGQMMRKAKDIASQTDSVNDAKISELQKMIDEGKYKVDAGAVADRLVDDHLLIPNE